MTDEEIAQMKKMNPKSPAESAREESIRKFLQGDDSQLRKVVTNTIIKEKTQCSIDSFFV
jgi:hypothetical protein